MKQEKLSKRNFEQGDIVYILFSPTNPDWPAIGTNREIDCKILTKTFDPTVDETYYSVISGCGLMYAYIPSVSIIPANEVNNYRSSIINTLMDTELCPAGTDFILQNGYFINDKLGIYIHEGRLSNLKHLWS